MYLQGGRVGTPGEGDRRLGTAGDVWL